MSVKDGHIAGKIIDPHLHFFALAEGDYHWLKPENPPFWPDKSRINHPYQQQDITSSNVPIAGFVHIEAGFDNTSPENEIRWLEQHATLPFKSIAFCDLGASDFTQQLARLTQYDSVVGIRHILDDDAKAILTSPLAQENLQQLAQQSLIFELQTDICKVENLAAVVNMLKAQPKLEVILNHAGFLPLQQLTPTLKSLLSQLSQFANLYVKASGWEMSNRQWQLQPAVSVITDLVQYFGDDRVMLASNFPVSELAQPYAKLWTNYWQSFAHTPELWQKLSYQNSHRLYRF
ncbi:amidohydrolase [Thalassotalea aquiviva]|uniref:amidohydrolase family protein n=1 Tax=Thalassotalea aquiviva TaxID=3242415 RepID=UPI00352B687F